jgi:hypothetical protein
MIEDRIAEATQALQALTLQLQLIVKALAEAGAKRNEYEKAIETRTPDFKTTSANRQARKAAAKVPRETPPAADSAPQAASPPTAVSIPYDSVVDAVTRVVEVKGMGEAVRIVGQFKTDEGLPATSAKHVPKDMWPALIALCTAAVASPLIT